jgi:hypothetical protein
MDCGDIYFAIKVDFKRKGRGVKNGAAIITVAQVALDVAGYLWTEAPFQILTNQANCGLAQNTHNGPPL